MLNQRLQQKLLQKLSPQQIQLMKLIQIPAVALEQRIKQEIEENPALEEMEVDGQDEHEDQMMESGDDHPESDHDLEIEERFGEFDIEDYLDDDHIPPYKLVANNRGQDDDDRDSPVVSGVSFQEHLLNQVGLCRLNDDQKELLRLIIGNIDDSGYLDRDPGAMVNDFRFSFNITTTKAELEQLLKVIHTFDPPGVGARDLQECLLIQLELNEDESEAVLMARKIIKHYFHEFSKKHYDRILKRANITSDLLKDAIAEIMKLNPKPGNSMGESVRGGGVYIVPDFFVTNLDGDLELRVNNRHMPELRINRTYRQMLEQYAGRKGERTTTQDKEALLFVKQKIDSAKWFIDAINQREQTLYMTMSAIMAYQSDYFRTGDETNLKPMILKDIAEIVGLDISTISRVANSKYVQTPFGTFLLKSFFSEGLQTESGEEVSSREVKKILEDCISGENKKKPLTDDQLSEVLKEKGYTLARRTVAKYREQLGIPVARMRKSL